MHWQMQGAYTSFFFVCNSTSPSTFHKHIGSLEIRPWHYISSGGVDHNQHLVQDLKQKFHRLTNPLGEEKREQRRLQDHIQVEVASIIHAISALQSVSSYAVVVPDDNASPLSTSVQNLLGRILGHLHPLHPSSTLEVCGSHLSTPFDFFQLVYQHWPGRHHGNKPLP